MTGSDIIVCEPDGADSLAQTEILFNMKTYSSYAEALAACRAIWSKNRDCLTSGWYRTDVVVDEQTSVFHLRCAKCKLVFASKNPANFWSSHKKKCTKVTKGVELSQGVHWMQ
jgi:hypothetical protein